MHFNHRNRHWPRCSHGSFARCVFCGTATVGPRAHLSSFSSGCERFRPAGRASTSSSESVPTATRFCFFWIQVAFVLVGAWRLFHLLAHLLNRIKTSLRFSPSPWKWPPRSPGTEGGGGAGGEHTVSVLQRRSVEHPEENAQQKEDGCVDEVGEECRPGRGSSLPPPEETPTFVSGLSVPPQSTVRHRSVPSPPVLPPPR